MAAPGVRPRTGPGRLRKHLRLLALGLVAAAVIVTLVSPASAVTTAYIATLAVFSTTRMVFAYLLSLLFAVSVGTVAARNKRAAVFILPVLDVLQSVPILGFFPAAIVLFAGPTAQNAVGVEVAIVFLIFTSMAWNMAFGVYESLTTIPHDLEAASEVFGLRDWLRFRRLYFPATVPKLVYNSILSWTVGWFYLAASEIFATSSGTAVSRPGLGQFIGIAGQNGDVGSVLVGVGALAFVVLLLDTFVWRPLSVWSERFHMELTAGGPVSHAPSPYERFRWLPRFPNLRRELATRVGPIVRTYETAGTRLERTYAGHRKLLRTVWRVDLAMFVVVFVLVVSTGILGLAGMLAAPLPVGAGDIPAALLLSFARLALAYGVAIAWTVPVAAWLHQNKRANQLLTPVLEIVASIPATALLPIILAFAVLVAGAVGAASDLAAFLVALFAMQWYLLFNVVAGFNSIPGDLEEAAKVFGLRRFTYWRRVLLPAVVPSLLTGSITAWGAGWNALIVSEFMVFGSERYFVNGIGALIFVATWGDSSPGAVFLHDAAPSGVLLVLAILAMVVLVLCMNKLLWRPLLKRASVKYRLEI